MSINIEDLTIKEARDLASLFGNMFGRHQNQQPELVPLCKRYVGKYVLVRARMSGINAGTVVDADETGIILKEARRLWGHRPKEDSESWYEGVAKFGLAESSKISGICPDDKAIIEGYEVIVCSSESEHSIRNFKAHKQR